MDQAQSPSQAPQPEQDDIQALRDRVRQLEDELASRKAQAHTQPESPPSPQAQQEQHAFVHDLVTRMSGADRTALHNWATRLLQVRHSGDTMLNKATQTLNATVSNKAALPAIKLLASEVKIAPLVTTHFAFADWAQAYRYIDSNGAASMKVMVDLPG